MSTDRVRATDGIALLSLRVGGIAPLGPDATPSAIRKRPLTERIRLSQLGLQGDDQADRKHHGGPDKALHHYPAEHYAAWRREIPERAESFEPGGFGENLSTLGLTEATICLGDIFRLGSALIQVSQGRRPCRKLQLRFSLDDMAARVQASGRTGWYYRVLQAGAVSCEDALFLEQRPYPEWPLERLARVLNGEPVEHAALATLASLEVLAPSWRASAEKRLQGA